MVHHPLAGQENLKSDKWPYIQYSRAIKKAPKFEAKASLSKHVTYEDIEDSLTSTQKLSTKRPDSQEKPKSLQFTAPTGIHRSNATPVVPPKPKM